MRLLRDISRPDNICIKVWQTLVFWIEYISYSVQFISLKSIDYSFTGVQASGWSKHRLFQCEIAVSYAQNYIGPWLNFNSPRLVPVIKTASFPTARFT